jgi:hypothetical protein
MGMHGKCFLRRAQVGVLAVGLIAGAWMLPGCDSGSEATGAAPTGSDASKKVSTAEKTGLVGPSKGKGGRAPNLPPAR